MHTASTEPAGSSADPALEPGSEVGEYRIEALIGRGGFGSVYRAVHPVIGKQVAIKVLARRYSADEAVVSRFQHEARAVNQIRHRNIIDIFAFGQLADGRHYYAMELLEGEPLDRVIDRAGPMSLAQALPILRALARALDAAHAKGIAHRDLKPENVFLARDEDGTVYPKLLDFGIAKLLVPDEDVRHRTGTGVPLGTPYYMSPEQCRGREVDHRTDVYSFGVLAYRLLTGSYPFTGDFMELMMKQIGEEPVPPSQLVPSLPSTVDAAISWMMRKDREDRPATILDAVTALDPGAPMTIPPPIVAAAPARPSQRASSVETARTLEASAPVTLPPRRRGSLAPIAAVVVAAAAGVAIWLGVRDRGTPSPAAKGAPAPALATPAPPAAAAAPPAAAATPPAPPAAAATSPAPATPPAPVAAPPPTTAAASKPVATKPPATHVHKRKHAELPPQQREDEPDDSHDVIHLPHDVFTGGK